MRLPEVLEESCYNFVMYNPGLYVEIEIYLTSCCALLLQLQENPVNAV